MRGSKHEHGLKRGLTTKLPPNKNQSIDSQSITILSFMMRSIMANDLKCRH